MLTYSVLVIVFILLISICSVVFGAKPIDQCKARMNDMKGAKLELACIELLDIEKMVNDETSIEVCYYSGGALRADGRPRHERHPDRRRARRYERRHSSNSTASSNAAGRHAGAEAQDRHQSTAWLVRQSDAARRRQSLGTNICFLVFCRRRGIDGLFSIAFAISCRAWLRDDGDLEERAFVCQHNRRTAATNYDSGNSGDIGHVIGHVIIDHNVHEY